MKKLSILAATFAAIVFASCGNKTAQNAESADSVVKSFEQEQIEASIKMHVDSLASEIGKLKMVPFLQADGNGGIQLTKEEKQVKPDYLLDPASAEEATVLSEKYRLLSALDVSMRGLPRITTRPSPNWLPTSTILLSRLLTMRIMPLSLRPHRSFTKRWRRTVV